MTQDYDGVAIPSKGFNSLNWSCQRAQSWEEEAREGVFILSARSPAGRPASEPCTHTSTHPATGLSAPGRPR